MLRDLRRAKINHSVTLRLRALVMSESDGQIALCCYGCVSVDRLPHAENLLLDPATIVGGADKMAVLVSAFDEHVGQEWYKTWPAFDWLATKLQVHMLSIDLGKCSEFWDAFSLILGFKMVHTLFCGLDFMLAFLFLSFTCSCLCWTVSCEGTN